MPGMLNPLILAISLPRRSTVALVNQLYCELAYLKPPASTYLRYRHLSLCALALATTAEPDDELSARYSPGNLWQVTAQLIEAFVRESPDNLDAVIKAEGLVSAVVDWCEGTVLGKGEDRAKWYDSEQWLALSNLWYTLARRVCSCPLLWTILLMTVRSLGNRPRSTRPYRECQSLMASARPHHLQRRPSAQDRHR